MKVLAFTKYSRLGASSRLRIYQYCAPLGRLGVTVVVSPLLRDSYITNLYASRPRNYAALAADYGLRIIQLLRVGQFDAVWIEKELFPGMPAWVEWCLHRLGFPVVVDIDDAVFLNYRAQPDANGVGACTKIDKVLRYSTLVIAGNLYLASRALAAGANRVEVLPTVVDVARYQLRPMVREQAHDVGKVQGQRIVVGWIGSPSTVKYLDLAAAALAHLTAEFSIELRVIGGDFAWPGVTVFCKPWFEVAETSEIAQFDIGIMPLYDTPWEHGKCGYKLIQYMACGVPVIASAIGANIDIVTSSHGGLLIADAKSWEAGFRELFTDMAMRRKLGLAGRVAVEDRYCLQRTAPKLGEFFKSIL